MRDAGSRRARRAQEEGRQAARQVARDEDEHEPERVEPCIRERDREEALRAVHRHRAEERAEQRSPSARRDPDGDLDRARGGHLARVDDPHLRHVERAGDPAEHGGEGEDEHLVARRFIPAEAQAALLVADGGEDAPELRLDDESAQSELREERRGREHEEHHLGARVGEREPEDPLEIGESVVAPEAGRVAEEEKHEGVGQRLRDDGEVDAFDARAEGEESEDEGEKARSEHDEREGPEEVLGAAPVPGQFLPVEKDHEVRKGAPVHPFAPDRAHEIHAHRVAAEGEEQSVSEAEDAAESPDEVERHRHHRVAEDLAHQRDCVVGEVEALSRRDEQVAEREGDDEEQIRAERDRHGERQARPVALREGHASSAARPRGAKSPCGRRWMKMMMKARTAILASTAPAYGSSSLFTCPRPAAAITVPASCPTPPRTTTMNESTMKPCPSSGPTLPICESAQPDSPAIPPRSAKASRSIHGVDTPSPPAMPRFCMTARTRSPSRVRSRRSQTMQSTATAKAMIASRLYGRTSPGMAFTPPDIQGGFATSTFCAPKIPRTIWMKRRLAPQVARSVSSGRP